MKFCINLFNDVNFEPDSIQPCCNVHGIEVPKFPFSGGEFPAQAYCEHIKNVLARIRNSENVCKGCPQLQTIDENHIEAAVKFKTVYFNQHRFFCNCKCEYCDLWPHKSRGYGYEVLPTLESLQTQDLLDKNCFFSWGGGEPSILPGFEDAAQWITKHGYWQNVHTNALIYSPAIGRMLRRDQGEINISLDSSSPEIYRNVKGINGFARVVDSLKKYVADARSPAQIVLKYIIYEKNNQIPEIAQFIKMCASLGIKKIQLSFDFREVNANKVSEQTYVAAAFMSRQARNFGIEASPFYLSREAVEKINNIAMTNFS